MNKLLSDCCSRDDNNHVKATAKLVLLCLLYPLAEFCNKIRFPSVGILAGLAKKLSGDQEQRLRLRLEYLANALRPRLNQISYHDILQVELEVTRVLRAVADSSSQLNNLW